MIYIIGFIIVIATLFYLLYALTTKRINHIDKVNKELISNVAHELKTPMTSILGFVETLQAGAIEKPEKAKYFMDIIASECGRLSEIIESTLELSRLENLKEDNNKTHFIFEDCLADTINVMTHFADEQEIKIRSSYDSAETTRVYANKVRIKQVLTNLFSNAIKYNNKGGRVDVSVKHQGRFLVVSVFNTGAGVDPDQLKRLFDRFYRADDGRTRKVGGTGLGLAIVKKIVALYGGKIYANSQISHGTTFTVYLPILA